MNGGNTCTCESPEPHEWKVDRARRTTVAFCRGCETEWDNIDGPREFSVWARGFTAGKRGTILKASETTEPEMVDWDQEHKSPLGPVHNGETVRVPIGNPLVGWPEWFLPLMKLRGFTYGSHRVAIDVIVTGCKASGITERLVVASFVAHWMPRRDQARWECPVAGLWDELGHWINEVVKAHSARRAAVLELASSAVGPEYGCRYCEEGGFMWVDDLRRDGTGGTADRWPVICDHTTRMASIGQDGPPWAWQPRGWDLVLDVFKKRLPAAVYTSWVMELELLGFDARVALVKCYNRVHATWIYRHLIEPLRDSLVVILGDDWVDLEMMMVWGRDDNAAKTT